MKVGRNDSCPCGSGKKYKKCCMEQDQEAAHVLAKAHGKPPRSGDAPKPDRGQSSGEALNPKLDKPLDPHIEALNARWEEFESLDYEGQIALFVRTVDEGVLMDHEMAVEMLDAIHERSLGHGELDRFDTLLEALRVRLPEVYARGAPYYLEWRIAHALATGSGGAIPALAGALAETAGRDIDIFNKVADQLAYHGQLSPLADAFAVAWPLVKESGDVIAWGVDEFAERAGTYAIFDALEQATSADDTEAVLKSRIGVYYAVDPDELARYIGYLGGQTRKSWNIDEFDFMTRPHSEATGAGKENLFYLIVEFLGYLRREEGVPYTKGELARQQIQQYLLERHAGRLELRESLLDAALRTKNSNRKPPSPPPDHGLCPDPETLDRYLGQLMNFIFPQRYKAAALMELMPAWLRFLESRQLIDAAQREKTLRGLRKLADGLLKAWEAYRADPALREGLAGSGLAIIRKDSGEEER